MISPLSNASSPGSVGAKACKARTRVTVFPFSAIAELEAAAAAGVVVVAVAVVITAAAQELPPQGMGYEQGHNRHPDIWVERMDEMPLSS